jgi:histone H3/H4
MASKKILPLAAMEKLMKVSGADRVSEEAKSALKDALEEIGGEIAERAVKLAMHSGRKTVKASDIKLASKS